MSVIALKCVQDEDTQGNRWRVLFRSPAQLCRGSSFLGPKLLISNGGRDRTRTCDPMRVKDVKIAKYLSFQGEFAAFAA